MRIFALQNLNTPGDSYERNHTSSIRSANVVERGGRLVGRHPGRILGDAAACPRGGFAEPTPTGSGPAADPLLIQRENAQPGALDWQLTRVRLDKVGGFRSPWIEGYCSKQSVQAGEALDIMVSTDPPARFTIEIFRTGYYGGRGARLMTTLGPFRAPPNRCRRWARSGCANAAGNRPPGS